MFTAIAHSVKGSGMSPAVTHEKSQGESLSPVAAEINVEKLEENCTKTAIWKAIDFSFISSSRR